MWQFWLGAALWVFASVSAPCVAGVSAQSVSASSAPQFVQSRSLREGVSAKNQKQRFYDPGRTSARAVVIVTTQRSGSGWLLRILESKSPPLDFRDKEPFGKLQHHVKNFNSEDAESYERHLHQIFSERCDQPSATTCGFKVMYNQIPHPEVFLSFAARYNVSIVHLVRQNVLRRFISLHYLHLDHSRSQVTQEAAAALGEGWKQEPFSVSEKDFIKLASLANEVTVWRQRLRDATLLGAEVLEITYEGLSHERTCKALLGFLAPELFSSAAADASKVDCSLADEFSDVQQHGEYRCDNFIQNWGKFARDFRSFNGIKLPDREFMIRHCELGLRNVTSFKHDIVAAPPPRKPEPLTTLA